MKFNQCGGFSLIEAMVAAFVFATGILGAASLQMKSLSMLSNSSSMSAAMFSVNGMADRMRANTVGVESGAYDDLDDQASDPNCGYSCSPAQLAALDVYTVYSQMSQELPTATLTVDNVGNDVFTIEATWTERVGENTATKRHRVSFRPYDP